MHEWEATACNCTTTICILFCLSTICLALPTSFLFFFLFFFLITFFRLTSRVIYKLF